MEGIPMNIRQEVRPYLEYCRFRKELDEKTIKAYRIDLRQYFEFVDCDMPEKRQIEAYITDLHKRWRQKTVKRKIASVKAFYRYLEDEELLSDNPFRKIRVKFKETQMLPRIIPRAEIERLLNSMYARLAGDGAGGGKYLVRDIAVVEVLFATGARVSEVCSIRADALELDAGLVRIMGKGGKERYIQIGEPAVRELLKRYYTENEAAIKASGYFFVNRLGGRYTEQSVRTMLKRYTRLAGIERNITPHMFRHSFATYLIEEGADISCVQQILGHSSIKTTQIYVHVAAAKQAELLKELHPRGRMRISAAA